ncbi:DEAD/DEAH box helicase [Stetteria hydrogenophila]
MDGVSQELEESIKWVESRLAPVRSHIVYRHLEVAGDPPPGPPLEEAGLHPRLVEALKSLGFERLYEFQYRALKAVRSGRDAVIVSGTGTGKTEAFLLPVLDGLLSRWRSVEKPYALVLYPTKALARDQLVRFKRLAEGLLGFRVAVLDGDTPKAERSRIYAEPPDILVSNPDMLHVGMAFSDRFRRLVSRASVVVLDELHVYSGVFGSHVKWVLYRLSRLAGDATFVGAGATIGNPGELGRTLFGRDVEVIEGPPRRRGAALHVFLDQGSGSRWTMAAFLVSALVRGGMKVLAFVDSQQMAELMARIASRRYGVRVGVHRAGLSPEARRSVEEEFREGELRAVVATPTMELGVDIGDLDAVVMAHLPRSYSSYVQRAGRAGRRGRAGLVATILGDDPIEAYYLRKPQEYFKQRPNPSYVEPGNREVAKVHAAALLLQSGVVEASSVPEPLRDALEGLEKSGLAVKVDGKYYPKWRAVRDFLEAQSSLRSSGPMVRIYEDGKVIGYRELPQALFDLYPDAVYYHGGRVYISRKLDVVSLRAEVKRVDADLGVYTKPKYTVEVAEIVPLEERRAGPLKLVYGDVRIIVLVEGYIVREEYSGSLVAERDYEEPIRWEYWTKGLATLFPNPGITNPTKLLSAYHAVEHTLIAAARPVVGAADTDLGGVSYPSGHVVIYDSAPGGHGASRLVFERFERVMELAADILRGCNCEDGCPRCVYSPYCGSGNRFLSRTAALKVLDYVLEGRLWRVPERPMSGKPLA